MNDHSGAATFSLALGSNSKSDLKAVVSEWGALFGIFLQAIEQSNKFHL